MGNLCGKASRDDDPFSQPGRRLGSAPATPAIASVPSASASPKSPAPRKVVVGGPPRTLGGGGGSSSPTTGGGGGGEGSSSTADDARARAAAAAEARFQAAKQSRGKLGTALDKQRAMTDAEALRQASEAERRQREMDQAAEAMRHS
ncbi:hypothetical protein VTJ49DRAFT_5317 [Mycothermus thermophilus]|uniref:Uncharacterized protein n=1 Tax=Humicola insolens TaxID=85995 RepID=A0ABR3V3F2_HUMIN